MPSIRTLAMRSPPPADAGERCAIAAGSQAIAAINAASSVSHRKVACFETNSPPAPWSAATDPRPPIVSGHKALHKIDDPDVDKIVPGGKDHQRQNQRQTDAEPILLRTLAERFSADRFSGIEQQVPPVKHRNREEIDQPEIDRQHRHEPDQRHDAALRDLARKLGDAQRAPELVGGTAAK